MARHGLPDGGMFDQDYRCAKAQAERLAGHHESAIRILRDLLGIYGSHALAHYRLGQIYEELGNKEDAEREYRAFLAAWSDADAGRPEVADAERRLATLTRSP